MSGIMRFISKMPPAGMRHGTVNVIQSVLAKDHKLEPVLKKEYFGAGRLNYFSTGKAALTTALLIAGRATGKTEVVVQNYTCYSVAASIRKAGMKLSLCDVDRHSLDFNYSKLEKCINNNTACIIATDLYSNRANIGALTELAKRHNILLIEDSAQRIHKRDDTAQDADMVVYSLDRGKPLSTMGGGILNIVNEEIETDDLEEHETSCNLTRHFGLLAKTAVNDLLVSPFLYWIPASLPFLNIGKTVYSEDFELTGMEASRISLLSKMLYGYKDLEESRRINAKAYAGIVARRGGHNSIEFTQSDGYAPARFPFYSATPISNLGIKRRKELTHNGIVPMYPTGLNRIEQIRKYIVNQTEEMEESDWITSHLLTAPTHQMVSNGWRSVIEMCIEQVVNER